MICYPLYLLISGKHDGRTAKLLLTSILTAVQEKLKSMLNTKPFLSVLTDGSQARKTGDGKEMMLARIEKNGEYKILFLCQPSYQGF